MSNYVALTSDIISSSGWSGLTPSNLSTNDNVYVTGGTAGSTWTANLADAPADFANVTNNSSAVITIAAVVVGNANRAKAITVELFYSNGIPMGVFNSPDLSSNESIFTSPLDPLTSGLLKSDIDSMYYTVTVTEGGGMPDSATVSIDFISFGISYDQAASATASGAVGALTASAFTGTATGTADVDVSGTINSLLASPVSASFTTSSTAAGLISSLLASSPSASGSGSAASAGLITGLSVRGADGSAYAVNNVSALVGFTDPPGQLIGAQEFRVLVRLSANNPSGAGIPTVSIDLYEGGVFVSSLVTGVQVTSDVGQVISVFWDASLLSNLAGTDVQCYITGTAGGTGFDARGVDIGAVEWNAAYQAEVGTVAYAKVAGVWKETTVYVNVSGTWNQAVNNVNVSGTWH